MLVFTSFSVALSLQEKHCFECDGYDCLQAWIACRISFTLEVRNRNASPEATPGHVTRAHHIFSKGQGGTRLP